MAGYNHKTTPLEMVIRDARLHQKEMIKHGNQSGIEKAQKKIDATLEELHYQQELIRLRATD